MSAASPVPLLIAQREEIQSTPSGRLLVSSAHAPGAKQCWLPPAITGCALERARHLDLDDGVKGASVEEGGDCSELSVGSPAREMRRVKSGF